MLCGSSSWLLHVTAVPGATVSAAGTNLKLSIAISTVLAGCCASAAALASNRVPAPAARSGRASGIVIALLLRQGDVGQRQGMRRRDGDLANADDAAQLVGRYLHGPGRRALARLWLRERSRHRGLERDLALDL